MQILSFLCCIIFAAACAKNNHKDANRGPRNQGAGEQDKNVGGKGERSPRESGDKCLRVVNGAPTTQYPAVALLIRPFSNPAEACTGTWVSDSTIITAAHCLDNSPTGGLFFIPGNQFAVNTAAVKKTGVQPIKAFALGRVHDGSATQSFDDVKKDLAVLVFNKGTAPSSVDLLRRQTEKGEGVEVVGFGKTSLLDQQQHSSVTKRYGINKVAAVDEDVILIQGRLSTANQDTTVPASDSTLAPGDSGGPLFIEGKLAGVISGAQEHKSQSGMGVSLFVNIFSANSKAFLEQVNAKGGNIPLSGKTSEEEADAESDCQ